MKFTTFDLFLSSLCGLSVFFLCSADSVEARQNIIIGDVSVRYDHQDRTYKDTPTVDAAEADGTRVIVVEDRRGDRQRYLVSPRLNFTSTGLNDVFEFTYAPALNYDYLFQTTDLDHDFGLHGKKNIGRNWLLSVKDRFFLGDDPVRESALKTVVVAPAAPEPETPDVEEPEVGPPVPEGGADLTERYGRRRYWTNSLALDSTYDYGAEKRIGAGYTYAVLRNDESGIPGGYTEYDRHTGFLSLDHRFSGKWNTSGQVRYTRGLFNEPDVFVVTAPEDGEDTPVDQVAGTGSDDLTEYNVSIRGGYDYSPRLHTYSEYSFLRTDYDSSLREDYSVNNLALGLDYNISKHLRMTLSGGPSWGAFEKSSTETDYNLHGGLTWDFFHGSFSVSGDKTYDQANFNGRRSGLTDVWKVGVALSYQPVERFSVNFSSSYRDNRRLEFPVSQTLVVIPGDIPPEENVASSEGFNSVEYVEKNYDAGLTLKYSFLRYYGISGGYRYYKYETDLAADQGSDYHEHRFFLQLSANNELFRW